MSEEVLVRIEVTNTSQVDGKEIVQLYVSDLQASVKRPPKELKDFRKVHLKAGETKTVYFTLQKRDFAFWEEKSSSWKVEAGEFEILIGCSSADIRQKKVVTIL
jgi:beta-glucosidase